MKPRDYAFAGILCLLAAFIWLRDTEWLTSSEDTLPILVALPLFFWLGSPWKVKKEAGPLNPKRLLFPTGLFLAGILLNFTLLLAAGWTALLWVWITESFEEAPHRSLSKLMVLPILAFPWVTLDFTSLGWWFRLTGAWATENLFNLLGFSAYQYGTAIEVNGMLISVEVACAGLNTLQSLLIAGSAAAYLLLSNTAKFWWNIPILALMAWCANTLRIFTLAVAALLISPDFALGTFHTWGGWLILVLMFGLCWLVFSLQEPKTEKV